MPLIPYRSGDRNRRAQQSAEVERELDADRRFFRRHPKRRHFIRPIYLAERAEFERVSNTVINTPPETLGLYVAVEQVRPGARLRALFVAEAGFNPKQPETVCAQIFEQVVPDWARAMRARIRETMP